MIIDRDSKLHRTTLPQSIPHVGVKNSTCNLNLLPSKLINNDFF